MRCLSLADALRLRGTSVRFLCHALPDHLAELVLAHGHQLAPLPLREEPPRAAEDSWPAARQSQDLSDCALAMRDWGACDWLVVDHYALDDGWERGARAWSRRLLAQDDLGRAHDCDLLLDPNLRPEGGDPYDGRVPRLSRRLMGPAHALLRPEYAAARAQAQPRDGAVRRLLVFLGGMDHANVTADVLRALDAAAVPEAVGIDVVVGASHPARDWVQDWCTRRGGAVCHTATERMAQLCAAADMAIGAGGSATWERCCVGLPTLALCLAPNQRQLLHEPARAGLVCAPDLASTDPETLAPHVTALVENSGLRAHLSRNGLAAVDGQGVQRVIGAMAQA